MVFHTFQIIVVKIDCFKKEQLNYKAYKTGPTYLFNHIFLLLVTVAQV